MLGNGTKWIKTGLVFGALGLGTLVFSDSASAQYQYRIDRSQSYKSHYGVRTFRSMARPSVRSVPRALNTQYRGLQNYYRYGDHRGVVRYNTAPRANWGSGYVGTLRRY